MLFNSAVFLYIFLPITLFGYYFLNKLDKFIYSRIWVLFCSLFFYSWWDPRYTIIIIISILVNYYIGFKVSRLESYKKALLTLGVVFNLGILFYYKYADFFLENVNMIFGTEVPLLNIVLPLGISFFTFQQVAYLVDSYRGYTKEYNIVNYGVFVSFFPQLIAGPIVHHKEMMPQFNSRELGKLNYFNLSKGLYVFLMGLSKKIILADSFGIIANTGYASPELLTTAEGWITSLSYSFQLYFDFSGYSDMAIGLGLMFNVVLPINFNSPYKSLNIQDFWRRWHITLSRFLRDYLYIPLGGNRLGEGRTYINLVITFLLGGIWHGAGWTFVFWGLLHGVALVVQRLFTKVNINVPKLISIVVTFFFINLTWVFFRATDWQNAMALLKSMAGLNMGTNSFELLTSYIDAPIWLAGIVLLFMRNTNQLAEDFRLDIKHYVFIVLLIVINVIFLNSVISQDFLYFDF